jgi:hypothetical protein
VLAGESAGQRGVAGCEHARCGGLAQGAERVQDHGDVNRFLQLASITAITAAASSSPTATAPATASSAIASTPSPPPPETVDHRPEGIGGPAPTHHEPRSITSRARARQARQAARQQTRYSDHQQHGKTTAEPVTSRGHPAWPLGPLTHLSILVRRRFLTQGRLDSAPGSFVLTELLG